MSVFSFFNGFLPYLWPVSSVLAAVVPLSRPAIPPQDTSSETASSIADDISTDNNCIDTGPLPLPLLPLNSLSFLNFLTENFARDSQHWNVESLKVPLFIDRNAKMFIYGPIYGSETDKYERITFREFRMCYRLAFTRLFQNPFHSRVPSFSSLIKLIQGICVICTPEYQNNKKSLLYLNAVHAIFRLDVYTNYRIIEKFPIVRQFFRRLLGIVLKRFKVLPLNTHDSSGNAEYSLVRSEDSDIYAYSSSCTPLCILLFYAANIKEIDFHQVKFAYELHHNENYMDIFGACGLRKITVASTDTPLFHTLFLTSEYDGSEYRSRVWPALKRLVITGNSRNHHHITHNFREDADGRDAE